MDRPRIYGFTNRVKFYLESWEHQIIFEESEDYLIGKMLTLEKIPMRTWSGTSNGVGFWFRESICTPLKFSKILPTMHQRSRTWDGGSSLDGRDFRYRQLQIAPFQAPASNSRNAVGKVMAKATAIFTAWWCACFTAKLAVSFRDVYWARVDQLVVLGMAIPPLMGNPYNEYINPYYWVDDHPLLYGNNGSLDPSTYNHPKNCDPSIQDGVILRTQNHPCYTGSFTPPLEDPIGDLLGQSI